MPDDRQRPRVPGSVNPLAKRGVLDPIMDRMRYVTPPPLAHGAKAARQRMVHEMRSAAAARMKKKGDANGDE
jgi:hypothetical protein